MYSDNNIRISLTGQKKEEVPSKLEIFYSIFETKSRKKNLHKTLLLKKLLIKGLLHIVCSLTYIQILLFIIILLKCSNPTQKITINTNKTPVVFVPGYKGSNLKEIDKNSISRVWLNPSQALGFSTPDLRLKNNDTISEDGILESITIPLLLSVKIYEPWINFLKNDDNIDPYFFSYDWRIDNGETALKLEKYLIIFKQMICIHLYNIKL